MSRAFCYSVQTGLSVDGRLFCDVSFCCSDYFELVCADDDETRVAERIYPCVGALMSGPIEKDHSTPQVSLFGSPFYTLNKDRTPDHFFASHPRQ